MHIDISPGKGRPLRIVPTDVMNFTAGLQPVSGMNTLGWLTPGSNPVP